MIRDLFKVEASPTIYISFHEMLMVSNLTLLHGPTLKHLS